jgi:multiple sugar transport system permease protein
VVFSLLIGAPAAFTLARYRFPGLAVMMFCIVSIRLFPDICSVIPVAEAFAKPPLSLIPAFFQVAMAHTLLSLPYVIYICMGVFKTIPKDLEEQAYILGASKFYAFRHVVIPVALSGMAAAAIYVFLLSWNEFIFAYFILFKTPNVSLPVYLLRILAWTPTPNFLAAISVILSIPVIIFSFAVQRYMISGMTAGAVK